MQLKCPQSFNEFDCPAGLAITSQAGGHVPKQVRHFPPAETLRQWQEAAAAHRGAAPQWGGGGAGGRGAEETARRVTPEHS